MGIGHIGLMFHSHVVRLLIIFKPVYSCVNRVKGVFTLATSLQAISQMFLNDLGLVVELLLLHVRGTCTRDSCCVRGY